jgi:hypothetical protein
VFFSKALTNLSKLYIDNKKKFYSKLYQFIKIYLCIYYNYCKKVGLPKYLYTKGFSLMLGSRVQDYYYSAMARQNYSFEQIVSIIQLHFETGETRLKYKLE